MTARLRHDAQARTAKAAVLLGLIWAALLALWLVVQASPLVVAVLMLATLPAAWDFAKGRTAWLELDDTTLKWQSGRYSGDVALSKIDKVMFNTRMDLSIRVRIFVAGGPRIVLPQDCLPPHPKLHDALTARGVSCERHHFRLY